MPPSGAAAASTGGGVAPRPAPPSALLVRALAPLSAPSLSWTRSFLLAPPATDLPALCGPVHRAAARPLNFPADGADAGGAAVIVPALAIDDVAAGVFATRKGTCDGRDVGMEIDGGNGGNDGRVGGGASGGLVSFGRILANVETGDFVAFGMGRTGGRGADGEANGQGDAGNSKAVQRLICFQTGIGSAPSAGTPLLADMRVDRAALAKGQYDEAVITAEVVSGVQRLLCSKCAGKARERVQQKEAGGTHVWPPAGGREGLERLGVVCTCSGGIGCRSEQGDGTSRFANGPLDFEVWNNFVEGLSGVFCGEKRLWNKAEWGDAAHVVQVVEAGDVALATERLIDVAKEAIEKEVASPIGTKTSTITRDGFARNLGCNDESRPKRARNVGEEDVKEADDEIAGIKRTRTIPERATEAAVVAGAAKVAEAAGVQQDPREVPGGRSGGVGAGKASPTGGESNSGDGTTASTAAATAAAEGAATAPTRRRGKGGRGLDVLVDAAYDARMEERRERNRKSAATANARRKVYVAGLKTDLAAIRIRASELAAKDASLRAENATLRRRLEYRAIFNG